MKKNLYILMASAALLGACSTETNGIRLDFDVADPSYGSVAVICHNTVYESSLDSLGHATCELPEMDAVYAKVFYGMDSRLIYAENGDRAKISFNGRDFNGTFRLDGDKAPAAEYLNEVTLTALPDSSYRLPFSEFNKRTEAKIREAETLLEARDLKGTGNFREMEKGRITYSYCATLLLYPTAHIFMAQDTSYVPDEAYYDAVRGYFQENPMYSDIDEYREFMAESAHVLDPEGRNIRELYPKLVAEMKYIASNCSDSKVKEALLSHIAIPYIDNFGIDGIEDMTNIYRTYVTSEPLVKEFNARYDKWDRKKPGRESADFSATGIDGRTYSLADFRGRYLYIDIWATWCQPCMMEMPHLKELEKKFEGRNITFLGLSTDSDKARWEAKVKSGDMTGVQLYLGDRSDFLKAYAVNSIPRFILLDRDGRIINPEMSRPSADETATFISSLEGI